MPKSKRNSKKMTTTSLVRLLRKQGKLSVYTKGGYKIPLHIGCHELKKRKKTKRAKRLSRSGLRFRRNSGGVTRTGRIFRRGGAKNSHNNKNNNKSQKIQNKNQVNNKDNDTDSESRLLKDVERNLIERLENIGIDPNALNNK